MVVEGPNKYGFPAGKYEQVLDNEFVEKVHLAARAPWATGGDSHVTHFVFKDKTYYRHKNGNVYEKVE